MTKIFNIRFVDGYMCVIDIDSEAHITRTDMTIADSGQVIASDDPSLGLPLLPLVEDASIATKLAADSWNKRKEKGETEFASDIDYIVGYVDGHEAASKKQYTEGEIAKKAEDFYNKENPEHHWTVGSNFGDDIARFFKSIGLLNIKPIPIAVEVEMTCISCNDRGFEIHEHGTHACICQEENTYLKPKVENGFVKVIRWIYD